MSGQFRCNKCYELKTFQPGEISQTIKSIQSYFHVDSSNEKYSLTYEYEFIENNKEVPFDDLYNITDFSHDLRTILFTLKYDGTYKEYISFKNHLNTLVVNFETENIEDANNIFKYIEEGLSLQIVVRKKNSLSDKYAELEERLGNVEKRYQYNKRLKCFISFRFNERVEKYVFKLTRFLELLDIEVITGIDYQPIKISDKVTSKLNEEIDFIIYLVTVEGESYWCRDELGSSYGRSRDIIPIVENGATLANGILSDWEYINFDSDHIGDVFLRLLEGIQFIRKSKKRLLTRT